METAFICFFLFLIFGQIANVLEEIRKARELQIETRDATRAAVYGLKKLIDGKEKSDASGNE